MVQTLRSEVTGHKARATTEERPMDQPIRAAGNSTPIACDMTTARDTPDERMAEYDRLFARTFVGRERTSAGIRFRLRADEGVEAWVRDLAAREKACCPFYDFSIATVGTEVHWDVRVVDDDTARAVLDAFYDVPDTAAGGAHAMADRLTGLGFVITTDDTGTATEVRPGPS
jgi:hypothetical protein